jgi:predicted dehydrogenase
MGNIDLSWSINKELERYISIYGSHGTVLVGWKGSKYRKLGSSDWIVFGSGYDKISAFRNQLTNFSRAISGDEELLINGGDTMASVEVIEAAYESMSQDHWTTVKNDLPLTT